MKLRSSSVTRFKEEIGNEKTNITDGNLTYKISIALQLWNCKHESVTICVKFIADL